MAINSWTLFKTQSYLCVHSLRRSLRSHERVSSEKGSVFKKTPLRSSPELEQRQGLCADAESDLCPDPQPLQLGDDGPERLEERDGSSLLVMDDSAVEPCQPGMYWVIPESRIKCRDYQPWRKLFRRRCKVGKAVEQPSHRERTTEMTGGQRPQQQPAHRERTTEMTRERTRAPQPQQQLAHGERTRASRRRKLCSSWLGIRREKVQSHGDMKICLVH